jgi:hypothetical protein
MYLSSLYWRLWMELSAGLLKLRTRGALVCSAKRLHDEFRHIPVMARMNGLERPV